MTEYQGPLPSPTPETQPFWDAAREHRLVLPYCAACDVTKAKRSTSSAALPHTCAVCFCGPAA